MVTDTSLTLLLANAYHLLQHYCGLGRQFVIGRVQVKCKCVVTWHAINQADTAVFE